ncbi:MAG TPA: hypothetical protein VNZ49_00145 [Bacteroidia bacterium]|jgi:hypothetical protein|nr:hypothetical protein [Bacteroidia bacterium]
MSNEESAIQAQTAGNIKCNGCGANLTFEPGTATLACQYCCAKNEIKQETTYVEEIDFEKFLSESQPEESLHEINIVNCVNCGASTTLKPDVTSDSCPFCDTPLIVKNATSSKLIKPKYLLPFKIERKKAGEDYTKWLGGLWFAPNDLKQNAQRTMDKLVGVYLPFWTYDSDTSTDYTGERGTYYYVTETYTNSKGETETREVQRIAWSFASGNVDKNFDDILVCASPSLPQKLSSALEPWDLEALAGFDERYLSGFKAESYRVDLKTGFETAKNIMKPEIESKIKGDIGGDLQRVSSMSTTYDHITFKHILLPVWISAYKYNEKVYHFMINARTGEVQGERPYSVIKIALTVIAGLAVIAAGVWFYMRMK